MNCYICNETSFTLRKGEVRDAPDIQILECAACGLVTLSSLEHIQSGFYEESGMHGEESTPITAWLKETEWDDQRRLEMVKAMLPNKRLLDFGCGAAGFLQKAQSFASETMGIELEARVREHWEGRLNIVPSIEAAGNQYDLITAFHVIEHLPDPRTMLADLAGLLAPGASMIVEVPNSEDALLTLYDCDAFQRFTYWSQHLFLFNATNLNVLARQSGLRVTAVKHFQRYPLSNHLYWLSKGRSGGHRNWTFLDDPNLANAYANALAAVGKSDTLIAHLERAD